jgi:hypothetical protein
MRPFMRIDLAYTFNADVRGLEGIDQGNGMVG